MSVFFNLIEETLKKENLAPESDKRIPKQFYYKDYDDFASGFFSFLNSKKYNKKIFILTDGIAKKSAVDSNIDIAEKTLSLLQTHYQAICVNLAQECGVNPAEIHASENFLEKTKELITKNNECGLFISLGSGTITDLLKHALYLSQLKNCIFISIPTAMTVTAFTSSFSVVDISGAKRTRPSHTIDATFWIKPLLQATPIELSRAGYGDLLARFVAYGDWYLGYKLGIVEKYSELAFRLMDVFANELENAAEHVGKNSLSGETIEGLSAALAMAGIAMSVTGETTPLSGYEHVISHALDFLHLTSQKELVLHGEQVALASLTSAMSFDWLLDKESFDFNAEKILSAKEIELLITNLLQKAPLSSQNDIVTAQHLFLKDYLTKHEKWVPAKEKISDFQKEWSDIKKHLAHLTIRASKMEDLIKKAKLPLSPEETNPTTTGLEYRWAVRFSPFVRARFCVADFIFWLGEDPCFVAAV